MSSDNPVRFEPHATLLPSLTHSAAGISKEEKRRIKKFLKQTLPDLFGMQRETLSDDEDDDENDVSTCNLWCFEELLTAATTATCVFVQRTTTGERASIGR